MYQSNAVNFWVKALTSSLLPEIMPKTNHLKLLKSDQAVHFYKKAEMETSPLFKWCPKHYSTARQIKTALSQAPTGSPKLLTIDKISTKFWVEKNSYFRFSAHKITMGRSRWWSIRRRERCKMYRENKTFVSWQSLRTRRGYSSRGTDYWGVHGVTE